MASFLRVSDIPPDELHLLPIIGLRQQIRADRNRPIPPDVRTDRGERGSVRPGRALQAGVPAAGVWAPAGGGFVTEWQLHDEPRLGPRLPFGGGDTDGKDRDDDDFNEEDFDTSGDGEAGEEDGSLRADENHNPGEDFDALYVDVGGEG
jgi:hypothetical protein